MTNVIKNSIPNTVTCLNLFSGCIACVMAFEAKYELALLFIALSSIFDFFDGLLARMLNAHSIIGKDLDSLADDVSFGVAPSLIVFSLFKEMYYPASMEFIAPYLPYLAFLISVFSALRLAKFNNDTRQTYSRYELTKQRMIEFLQKEYKLSDIPVKEITVTHIENFYLYLRQECEVSNNTAMKFVQRFHTILLFAQKSGLSFIDPFGNFKFNFDKTDRGYLTQEEIDTIYYKEFKSKRLEHVRDAFIFSCYTGLPYCDIYTLSSEDIKIGVDGKKWIMKDRGKTGVESFIPLLQIPLDILAKYEGKLKNGKLLPVISNQKMNEYLAEIAAICQINKRITYHLARHSFATEICLTKGVPIESVSKMLGHTNIQTTQIYARVVDRKLSHDMNMLDRKLKSMQKGTTQNAV